MYNKHIISLLNPNIIISRTVPDENINNKK
jgi:hypothetical protein